MSNPPSAFRAPGAGALPDGAHEAVGPEGDALALLDPFDAFQGRRFHRVLELAVPVRPREPDGFLLAGDDALDVDAPDREAGLEGDRLEGDPELGAPAVLEDARPCLPDAVPVEAGFARVGEPFAAGAERVDEEHVGRPLVLERIEEHPDEVVARPRR